MKELLKQKIFIVGFIFVLLGVVFPFLMTIQVIEASLWLNFLSYAMSITGMFMGVVGAITFLGHRKEKDNGTEDPHRR